MGLLRSGRALDEERDRTAEKLRAQSSFQRATPPEAKSSFDQDEVGKSVVRMADFLKHFQGKSSRSKKKSRPGQSNLQKAISTYMRVSQSETEESQKGFQFSKFV